MSRIRTLSLTLACAALLAPASFAQDITGAWSFKTDIKRKGCTITGNMTISPASENGARTCSFVSTEVCENAPGIAIVMDQTCRITPQAKNYIMRSQVIASQTEGYDKANYLADHFVVKSNGPKEMKGLWQDARFSARVIFWRNDALPVS